MPKLETAALPQLNLESLQITIEGVTPLITNRFSESTLAKMEAVQSRAAKVARQPRNPEQEFREAVHPFVSKDKNVHGGFPASGIKKSLVRAGTYAGEKMTRLKGVIQIMGDVLPVSGSKPVMRKDRVVLASGVTSIAYRPMFEHWKISVDVKYNANEIIRDQILNLFRIAGFSVGIGCWRPENDGTFGQFDIIKVETTEMVRV